MLPEENFIAEINGRKTSLYTLKNNLGLSAQITNYGAALVGVFAPDKEGRFEDVVLGYENIQDYASDPYFHGAIVGGLPTGLATENSRSMGRNIS